MPRMNMSASTPTPTFCARMTVNPRSIVSPMLPATSCVIAETSVVPRNAAPLPKISYTPKYSPAFFCGMILP